MNSKDVRYGSVAIALHWLIGAALLLQIAFGFMVDDLAPRNTPARTDVINLHKSIGMTIGVLILVRLLWRLTHRPPSWPASLPAWQERASRWVHRGLYACMVTMPLAGFVASNFSKYGVRYFGIALKPLGPVSPSAYAFFHGIHVATAYVFTALIVIHVAAALKHALVDRDDVLSRMLPRRGVDASSRAWVTPDASLKEHP